MKFNLDTCLLACVLKISGSICVLIFYMPILEIDGKGAVLFCFVLVLPLHQREGLPFRRSILVFMILFKLNFQDF